MTNAAINKRNKPNIHYKKGITLVELLIVVGIVTIISLSIIPSYAEFSSKKDFNNKVETFVNEIALIRNKSLAGAVFINGAGVPIEVHWGIRPICSGTFNTYALGYRTDKSSTITTVSTQRLPTGVTFDSAACSQIVFARLTGIPHQVGSITLKFSTLSRTITVNSSGRIVYDESI